MDTLKKTLHVCFCAQLSISHVHNMGVTDSVPNYKTFFSAIHGLEKLPLTFYVTGSFLDWQKGKRQAYTMLLNQMRARKQIELLSGGYYQPYFPLLPLSDTVGQIELMTAAIRTHFGKRPRGIFVDGSAWNSSLIPAFSKCGMDYCLLDCRFFPSYKEGEIPVLSPVILEQNGKTITAFPYLSDGSQYIHDTPEAFYEKLVAHASDEMKICLIHLPVSRYIACLEKNKEGKSWFSSFIDCCNRADSPVKLTNTAAVMKQKEPLSLAYIPANTIFSDHITGTSVKHTLMQNADAFQLYTKMMYVHTLANGVKGDKSRKKYALQELWKAQNAELFTLEDNYKLFGTKLRRIAYRNLLVAEKQTRLPGVFADGLLHYDINLDGTKEVLSQRFTLNMYVQYLGGKIFETDVFQSNKNYCDLPCENAGMFIDHLVSAEVLESLKNGNIACIPPVFSNRVYNELDCDTIRCELKLSADGFFDSMRQPVSLRKQYRFFNDGVQVQYILKNDSPFNLSGFFMVEVDIALDSAGNLQPELSVFAENEKKSSEITRETFNQVSWVQLDDPDGKTQFTMEANEVPNLIIVPVYKNVPEQDGTFIEVLKGLRSFFYWKTDLNANYETEKILFLKVNKKK